MPSIYTHNKFGIELKEKLNPNIKNIIEKYEKYYRLGLQGADIFFFNFRHWSNSNSPGKVIHKNTGRKFFEINRDFLKSQSIDSPTGAYLVGFLAHYIADSKMHPIVNSLIKDNLGHISIETELDRHFLIIDGENPMSYKIEKIIPLGNEIYNVVAPFYNKYEYGDYKSVKNGIIYFHLFKRILRHKGKLKEKILYLIMDLLGVRKSYEGQVMKLEPIKGSEKTNEILDKKFYEVLNEAPNLVRQGLNYVYEDGELTEDFDYNFDGILGGENGQ